MRLLLIMAVSFTLAACTSINPDQAKMSPQEPITSEIGPLKITWLAPDNYRDVKATNGSSIKYRNNVFNQLQKHLHKELINSASGYQVVLTVSDVDLAGQVWPASLYDYGHAGDIRIIKQVDYPRVAFDYVIKDKDGQLLRAGSENLKDMSFQQRAFKGFKSDALRYEKNMLGRWLNDTIKSVSAEDS